MLPLPWNFFAVLTSSMLGLGGEACEVRHVTVTMELLLGCLDVSLRLDSSGVRHVPVTMELLLVCVDVSCYAWTRVGPSVTSPWNFFGCVDVLLRLGWGGGACYRHHGTFRQESNCHADAQKRTNRS